jgi:carbonic anhydrase
VPSTWDPNALLPEAALQRLVEGNRRFLERGGEQANRAFRPDLAERAQRPFAIVLGCSDSRTPVEFLFDEGFGDLFVVRIAGHVVAPSVVGSIEFAASQFGTRLVVVLGHTRCGAISATVGAVLSGNGPESKNIRAITDRISPHIEGFVMAAGTPPAANVMNEAMRINVRAAADHLRHGSPLLEELVRVGRVAIVGAEYELETGRVNFFDGVPLGRAAAKPSASGG